MLPSRLWIQFDQISNWVELRIETPGRVVSVDGFELPIGFKVDDVRESLMAGGAITLQDDKLVIHTPTNCQQLRERLVEVFSYFRGSLQPNERLIRIKNRVDSELRSQEFVGTLSLWAYAWLDLMVREDLADEARSVADIWDSTEVSLPVEHLRQRRLIELISRGTADSSELRMAASARSRRDSRIAKDGTSGP